MMLNKLTSLVALTLISFVGVAQINIQWESRYTSAGNNIDRLNDMVTDPSGNVYVTGADWGGTQGFNYRTIKLNNLGGQIWSNTYDAASFLDEAVSVDVDDTGNVYITGQSAAAGLNYDVATIKYDSAGNQDWVRRWNGTGNGYDRGVDVHVDGNGDIYVAGEVAQSSGLSDFVLLKYDHRGNVVWNRTYNGPANNIDAGLIVTTDALNNVYIAGHSTGSGTDLDIAVRMYDSGGNLQWTARSNYAAQNQYDVPVDMTVDPNGAVYVTGLSYGGASDADFVILKINPNGNIAWTQRYDGSKSDYDKPARIKLGPQGKLYIPGRTIGDSTAEDMTLLVYDTLGNLDWSDHFNGQGQNYDEATDIVFDAQDFLYVTGYSYTSATNNDFTTIKYDTTGTRIWLTKFDGTANNSDQAWVMDIDAGANIYVSGTSKGSGTGEDFSTIKYCQFQIFASPDTAICTNGVAQLNVTGSSTGYAWWPSAGLSDTTIANPIANPTATTTYFVVSTNATGCTNVDTVIVTVNPVPNNTIDTVGTMPFCVGDSVQLKVDSTYASYSWTTGDTTFSTYVSTGGLVQVTITDTLGCSALGTVTVNTYTQPPVNAGPDINVCDGDSIQLLVTGGNTYTWHTQLGLSDSTIANPWFFNPSTQTYFVTGVDGNGCSNVDTIVVTVDPSPTAGFTTGTDTTYLNKGGIMNFIDQSINPASWMWDFGDGAGTSNLQNPVYTYTAPGVYTICLKVTLGNCSDSICDSIVVLLTDGVGEIAGLEELNVYPNPTRDRLNLSMKAFNIPSLEYAIVDQLGRVVYQSSERNLGGWIRRTIDVADLRSGAYLLRLSSETGVITTRFIKH